MTKHSNIEREAPAGRENDPGGARHIGRRRFLIGVGATSAAAVAVVGADARWPQETPAHRGKALEYVETEHIRAFYASARF